MEIAPSILPESYNITKKKIDTRTPSPHMEKGELPCIEIPHKIVASFE